MPDNSNEGWFYALAGQRFGPVHEQILREKIISGELTRETKIWRAGLPNWILVGNSSFQQLINTPPPIDGVDLKASEPAREENVFTVIQQYVSHITGMPPLENFQWRNLFSQAFKFKDRQELDRYFNCGCSRTTPEITEIQAQWPHPWAFSQVLVLATLALLGLWIGTELFHNLNAMPGLIFVGAFAMPLACLVFFFELNILRNISTFQLGKLLMMGGILSIIVSLVLYRVTGLADSFLGATSAGIVEEIAKLLTAVFLASKIKGQKWVLNGILIGAAVGAGFAGFETAGYILLAGEKFYDVLLMRAVLAPFCHVVWTAITVGALWRTKGDAPFEVEMLWRKDFLRVFGFVVALHMLWNSGLLWMAPSGAAKAMAYLWSIPILGSWYLVLTIAQAGLKEIQQAQALKKSGTI
jgi:protease PrsW